MPTPTLSSSLAPPPFPLPSAFPPSEATREFTIKELKTATNNWQTVVGKGGYGTVYKAVLKDGTYVAVKRLDQVGRAATQGQTGRQTA